MYIAIVKASFRLDLDWYCGPISLLISPYYCLYSMEVRDPYNQSLGNPFIYVSVTSPPPLTGLCNQEPRKISLQPGWGKWRVTLPSNSESAQLQSVTHPEKKRLFQNFIILGEEHLFTVFLPS